MDKKNHVGRPTNEELIERKKKAKTKFIIIIVLIILLGSGIYLIVNKNNIDFSSIMGNSSTSTWKYVDTGNLGSMYKDIKILDSIDSCEVSNKKVATCNFAANTVMIFPKKKGTTNIIIKGRSKNTLKFNTITKTLIIDDFTPPTCKIKSYEKLKKSGSRYKATFIAECYDLSKSIKVNSKGVGLVRFKDLNTTSKKIPISKKISYIQSYDQGRTKEYKITISFNEIYYNSKYNYQLVLSGFAKDAVGNENYLTASDFFN